MLSRSREGRGEPIPGSRYVRDFCAGCGEPIRVTQRLLDDAKGCPVPHFCDRCGTRPMGPPPRCGPPDETTPEWENAIRALEDAGN